MDVHRENKMNKTIPVATLLLSLLYFTSTYAEEIKTFKFESVGGSITVTQDIPSYFLGSYKSISPELLPGDMVLNKGRNQVSFHWRDKDSKAMKFTWGVVVKNGKIEQQRITPPNSAYKPYDRMKLIIRYEDENKGLVAWGLYRAVSEKYGTRIVVGRYLKQKAK